MQVTLIYSTLFHPLASKLPIFRYFARLICANIAGAAGLLLQISSNSQGRIWNLRQPLAIPRNTTIEVLDGVLVALSSSVWDHLIPLQRSSWVFCSLFNHRASEVIFEKGEVSKKRSIIEPFARTVEVYQKPTWNVSRVRPMHAFMHVRVWRRGYVPLGWWGFSESIVFDSDHWHDY